MCISSHQKSLKYLYINSIFVLLCYFVLCICNETIYIETCFNIIYVVLVLLTTCICISNCISFSWKIISATLDSVGLTSMRSPKGATVSLTKTSQTEVMIANEYFNVERFIIAQGPVRDRTMLITAKQVRRGIKRPGYRPSVSLGTSLGTRSSSWLRRRRPLTRKHVFLIRASTRT